MGILNLTPDSFSDGGQLQTVDEALRYAEQLIGHGADILDVGAQSTRPGSIGISSSEEIDRLKPFVERYSHYFEVPLSVDTYQSEVVSWAISYGVSLINDVSALRWDSKLGEVVAKANLPIILMHSQGKPKDMQVNPMYEDVYQDVYTFLASAIHRAHEYGIEQVMIDPGFGFGKSVAHNVALLKNLAGLGGLEVPIVVGLSRKSFLGALSGEKHPREREIETTCANTIAILNGTNIIRVHDVGTAKRAAIIADSVRYGIENA